MADKTEVKKTRTLVSFTTLEDINLFGIHSKHFSATMQYLKFSWNGEVIVVTYVGKPGEEKWVFPASLATLTWTES